MMASAQRTWLIRAMYLQRWAGNIANLSGLEG